MKLSSLPVGFFCKSFHVNYGVFPLFSYFIIVSLIITRSDFQNAIPTLFEIIFPNHDEFMYLM